MKKALLICYYFPPLGGAGVARPLNFFTYLPKHGVECDVLTVKPVAYRQYEPELLPEPLPGKIYRAGSFDPQRLLYLMGMRKVRGKNIDRAKSVSDLFFPDPKIGWYGKALRLGRTLVENRRYDVIISSSPPMTSHKIAMQLAKEFSLPWLADFRDYWTSYKVEDWFENKRQQKKAKKFLSEIVTNATEVITANDSIATYLEKGSTLYSGFDNTRARKWKNPEINQPFTIGLLGTYDSLCPVEPLSQILSSVGNNPEQAVDKLSILHVGTITDYQKTQLNNVVPVERCEFLGNLDRSDTITRLSQVHMFYLGLSKSASGIIPGRIFDMLASGRPILMYSEDKHPELRSIADASGNSKLFLTDEKVLAAEWLVEIWNKYQQKKYILPSLPAHVGQFSANAMAQQLASKITDL